MDESCIWVWSNKQETRKQNASNRKAFKQWLRLRSCDSAKKEIAMAHMEPIPCQFN